LFLVVLPIILISCNSGYKKIDGKWAYVSYDEGNWEDKHFLDVDSLTFKVLPDVRYAKDQSKVFFEGRIIDYAISSSFRVIGNEYSADDSNVFLREFLIVDANSKTFKLLRIPYSRDNEHIFCGTVPLFVDDIESFEVTEIEKGYVIQPLEVFIRDNPEYARIDTLKHKYMIYGLGAAKEGKSKFKGFKKIN